MKKFIIAIVMMFAAFSANADCYSEGVRSGVIQKFSNKGLISKSWEGEMVQEGVRVKAKGQGAGVTNIWKFSVLKADVAQKINDAMFNGGEVTVKYCQSFIKNLFAQDTSYEVTDVRVNK
jgi:hypothetical protein